ncbi:ligase-associated DNA damage response DEXH box helicase [bacterium SCSIO 12741]|nr:ligase-associated DNA damage response DEXH box helicase [bacterium SCSIO 12741]
MSSKKSIYHDWFAHRGWKPFPFQERAREAYLKGNQGLVNAPTGSGKTYSLALPILEEFIHNHPEAQGKKWEKRPGLQAIWITPIRALTKEIEGAVSRAVQELDLDWRVAIRSGDTSQKEKADQKKQMPEFLITTPESIHILLAQKGYARHFKNLKAVVVDEWHDLLGTKRGVLVELLLSRLRGLNPALKTWGISATIGNLDQSLEVLLGKAFDPEKHHIIQSRIKKKIVVETLMPDEIEEFPWSGHIGIRLLKKVIPIIRKSKSTLIFTNTRSMAEIWYQRLLAEEPELAGVMAMHHGSISKEIRFWVEDALYDGQLKAVVCTSSLDLGVDFRPVENIVQIGSPKGVSRFMQRAGRSGHQPGATSKIWFVPTHSLEIVESAALRYAMEQEMIEDRTPYVRSFDVLVQYLVTLAVSDGFYQEELYAEIKGTHCYSTVSEREWNWVLDFITSGGQSLSQYPDFHKVVVQEGLFKVVSRKVAQRHRLSIGTIVSDVMMTIKYKRGKRIGNVEEWFIARLNPGDVFWFAGRNLELVKIRDLTVEVIDSKQKTGKVPSWQGGRMPLSSQMSATLRDQLNRIANGEQDSLELTTLQPLVAIQQERSIVPNENQLLIEKTYTEEGCHVFVFPFDGRNVHEGMAALLAYRISLLQPISFSMAMNDYGFELLSDQDIPIETAIDSDLLSSDYLREDIQRSLNATEMARRRFRDIASIAGLIFQGYPGKQKKTRHVQASSSLFFDVFNEYEGDNLLLLQAYEEAMEFQLEEARLRQVLDRIAQQEIVLTYPDNPSPFAFPIMVDRLREKITSETLADRIKKMQVSFR